MLFTWVDRLSEKPEENMFYSHCKLAIQGSPLCHQLFLHFFYIRAPWLQYGDSRFLYISPIMLSQEHTGHNWMNNCVSSYFVLHIWFSYISFTPDIDSFNHNCQWMYSHFLVGKISWYAEVHQWLRALPEEQGFSVHTTAYICLYLHFQRIQGDPLLVSSSQRQSHGNQTFMQTW